GSGSSVGPRCRRPPRWPSRRRAPRAGDRGERTRARAWAPSGSRHRHSATAADDRPAMARVQALPRPGYNPGVTRHLLAAILVAILLVAERPTPVTGQAKAASDAVVATTLDNGLRVLLLEDHRSPIVSLQVWYRVGSRNELRGATGIAHFLEHLMFRGTPTNGPGVYARAVERNGGQNTAFTPQDVTSYYVDIAADRLD